MSDAQPVIGLLVIAVSIVAIWRALDVRFVLILAGLLLLTVAGTPWKVFDTFQEYVGRGDIVGPICSAMGYAFVLKATGCDREMVRLLLRPISRMRLALVPGACVVGFFTNMAITSQTASAAAVGPILLPLMAAAGYRPIIAGAVLLVGCSVGGNLFNPGEPHIVAIGATTAVAVSEIISMAVIPNTLSFLVATATLMVFARRQEYALARLAEEYVMAEPPHLMRALMPPLPVALLLLLQPGLSLWPALFEIYPSGLAVSLVMLVCTGLVMLVTRRDVTALTRAFFDGMGYAFTHVVSLIIAAACFIAGLDAVGLIDDAAAMLAGSTAIAGVVSPLLTWGLALVSGTATAPSVSFSQAMLPAVAATDALHAVRLGVAGAIGASVGRTMSPVAAIVLFTATLTDTEPKMLVRLVMWPMLASLVTIMIYGALANVVR